MRPTPGGSVRGVGAPGRGPPSRSTSPAPAKKASLPPPVPAPFVLTPIDLNPKTPEDWDKMRKEVEAASLKQLKIFPDDLRAMKTRIGVTESDPMSTKEMVTFLTELGSPPGAVAAVVARYEKAMAVPKPIKFQ